MVWSELFTRNWRRHRPWEEISPARAAADTHPGQAFLNLAYVCVCIHILHAFLNASSSPVLSDTLISQRPFPDRDRADSHSHSLSMEYAGVGPVANSMDLKSACENVAFFGFGYLIRDLLYVRDACG